MWTTNRVRKASVTPRPIRVAYLVPNPPSHALLDALFDECVSRWGGRRTPIIPTDGNDIAGSYLHLLDLWDADVIYSYVTLSDRLHARIAHRFAPAEIIQHERPQGEEDERRAFRPELATNISLLSSVSVLPLLARRRAMRGGIGGGGVLEVLDRERWAAVARDIVDSFGFVSDYLMDFSLLPHARRACYQPPAEQGVGHRFLGPDEISYIGSEADLLTALGERRALVCMAQMADLFTPYLSHVAEHGESWELQLTLVVGDEIADRLLLWNAIHRYAALESVNSFQVLRISPTRFAGGTVPEWVMRLCSWSRNFRHLPNNAAPQTVVCSCSVDEATLNAIAAGIRGNGQNLTSAYRHADPQVFGSIDRLVREARQGIHRVFPSVWRRRGSDRDRQDVRFSGTEFEVPLAVPAHVEGESASIATRGAWAVDLRIDRNEDHSAADNITHRWWFPRRLRLDRAVDSERRGADMLAIPPTLRPTDQGDLAMWDTASWRRPVLHLPSDIGAFAYAVSRRQPLTREEDEALAGRKSLRRFEGVKVSDKGRDLLGVFQLFRSFAEARVFLTNDYVLSVIERLVGGEDRATAERRAKKLGAEIAKIVAESGQAALDTERLATRALGLARQSLKSEERVDAFVSYEVLWQLLPPECRQGEGPGLHRECVTYLRDRGFFQQGYGWTCERCQYRNWAGLEDLTAVMTCAICRAERSAPVSGDSNIHFRLNPFVAEAFSDASAQGPVIWCLDVLARRAVHCLAFTPALDVRWSGEGGRATDIDLLAAVDGEVCLIEVKKGFAGIDDKAADELIALAQALRPDVAGFAVKRSNSESSMSEDLRTRIEAALREVDTRFVLITDERTARTPEPRLDIPGPIGREMSWSAW